MAEKKDINKLSIEEVQQKFKDNKDFVNMRLTNSALSVTHMITDFDYDDFIKWVTTDLVFGELVLMKYLKYKSRQ